ncbi:MAG: 23S rRNA (pseudouridine(1915)-N(3))-methyltransferase RlmH [Lachnospiraceae bacterium]|nr:23S rRNA (pseudouridine(1915)-N(3))-methyltransferase RlmH [Lachnospiraceae bacterium]
MNIDILCVGRLKEQYLKAATDEYSKRLSRYCRLSITEVADEKTVDGQSEALDQKVKETEGERLLKNIKTDAYVIALEIDGEQLTSEKLASRIEETGVRGFSKIQFVIGGSLGLSEDVIKRADMHLSFSKMTFPHQLMRVILLEQIYRSFRINNNEPYHK